ncbi:hypothetical protein L6452_20437 [Arctium lappa]|uniref:Uncharacterized protein n=1 Tax=Arctium lappa TaxID=4217 RepID=A0ACB9BC53_ARCLA|nr:hypothetical protein L6452_20437 [Arctium lappa]
MDCFRLLWSVTIGLLLVSRKPVVFAVPSCTWVKPMLAPCLGYINGQEPSSLCCSAVESIKAMEKTKSDRVAICNCVKQATKMITYNPKRLPLLPKKCGVDLKFPPIGHDYDCKKVDELSTEVLQQDGL